MNARLEHDRIHAGEHLAISFERTLRIPDDGKRYPLPPGLGLFPIRSAAGDFVIPMYQSEALWIAFEGAWWKPNAVKVGVGGIDALTGDAWSEELQASPQNYLVAPDQPWIDGINSGDESVRQFVAMPLGSGVTIEGQLTGEERIGGLQFVVFAPKDGRFPDEEPEPPPPGEGAFMLESLSPEMGMAAGGQMTQKIYPDTHGIESWDASRKTSFRVRIANSEEWRALTGEEPPPSPVDAAAYTKAGLPWFALYDERKGDVAPSAKLRGVRSVGDAATIDVQNVKKIRH
ncbi:MAG TPA: hypothetical protein VND45_07130 [Thermoanaerobaculia bacterium]|nr:hypothetical protein [Thermoanaerobaculia bacterium]